MKVLVTTTSPWGRKGDHAEVDPREARVASHLRAGTLVPDPTDTPTTIEPYTEESEVEPEPEVVETVAAQPDSSWLKADIQEWMDRYGVAYTGAETKADLIELIEIATAED